MKCRLFILSFSVLLLVACEAEKPSEPQQTLEPVAQVADPVAGKDLAQQCGECHGVDGAQSKQGAPFIGGQQQQYMVNALNGYKSGKRKNETKLATIASLTEADVANVSAYYAEQQSAWNPAAYKQKTKKAVAFTQKDINAGKNRSQSCVGCHGDDGNSILPGVPTLAGLQGEYIKSAINAYFKGERIEPKVIMKNFKHSVNQKEIHQLAAYYSTQTARRSTLPSQGSVKAGEKIATSQCAGCHGIDGNSISPTMPSLTGQNHEYLVKAINAYKNKTRKNTMMQAAVKKLSAQSIQNLAAYYAAQKPEKITGKAASSAVFDPIADGEKIASSCNGCHGIKGNSANAGTPSLTRLHPSYLAAAINAYKDGSRQHKTMKTLVASLEPIDIEKVATYYALQEPLKTKNSVSGDVAKGEELGGGCNGCHGENGNSTDAKVPALAGQDPKYIVNALKHYADGKRANEDMANAVKELSVEQMRDVAAYYAAQTPMQLENINVPKAPEVLAEQCNRCHGENGFSTEADKPRLAGQIETYLANALHSYRDGTRESTAMHAMADVLTLTELKAIAAYYSKMQR